MIPWLYITMQLGFGADSIFYIIHLCYMYRVIIGGNLVRLSKESRMQKTRLISLDCHLPYLIQYFLSVENTGLKKTDKSKSNFHYLPEINNC